MKVVKVLPFCPDGQARGPGGVSEEHGGFISFVARGPDGRLPTLAHEWVCETCGLPSEHAWEALNLLDSDDLVTIDWVAPDRKVHPVTTAKERVPMLTFTPRGCYCRMNGHFEGWHLRGSSTCVARSDGAPPAGDVPITDAERARRLAGDAGCTAGLSGGPVQTWVCNHINQCCLECHGPGYDHAGMPVVLVQMDLFDLIAEPAPLTDREEFERRAMVPEGWKCWHCGGVEHSEALLRVAHWLSEDRYDLDRTECGAQWLRASQAASKEGVHA